MREINSKLAMDLLPIIAQKTEDTIIDLLPKPIGMEQHVIDAMRYAVMAGGKRLRPFLTVETAALFNVEEVSAIRVAAAIECVHTYSLIHDDLPAMDDDDMRRGNPSVHRQFDEATAILAGDALLTLAFEILADEKTHPDPEVRSNLVLSMAKAIGALGMVGGQMIDLKAENQQLNKDQIKRMQRMKTGELIVFSCKAGALLANVNEERQSSLSEYANNIGLAFQVIDDLLDIVGNSADIGKTVGKDIEAGKATVVSLMGISDARKYAEDLVNQAIASLEIFDDKADGLRSLAMFILHRVH